MGNIYSLLGILTVIFAVLAATNAMKKYTKNGVVKYIASKHKIFGMIAILLALTHMFLAILDGELRITGLITILFVLLTGTFGVLFYRLKKKNLYITHRILAVSSILMMIIHIVFNHQF